MTAWRVTLQAELSSGGFWRPCLRYDLPGVAVPAHISIVACDHASDSKALELHREIVQRLRLMGPTSEFYCGQPKGFGCGVWNEPSCLHVLVLLIGDASLDSRFETLASKWISDARGGSSVLTALIPPLDHASVFGSGEYSELAKVTAATWQGDVQHLASTALALATLDEKPGVFVSYVRRDARTAADDIHDALVRAGYRVFLDRFTGTQGRVFPHELAEAMADHGLVLLLETPSVFDSDWTKWELAFARRYRLGPIAVNFNNARRWRAAAARINEFEDPLKALSTPLLERVVRFVGDTYLGTAVARRAYFETLVQLAAQSKQGGANAIDGGLMALTNSGNVRVGSVLPGAVPGRLRHVKRLVDSPIAGPRVLAGQHEHLRARDRDDLRWLAKLNAVTLAGPASVFSAVRRIL